MDYLRAGLGQAERDELQIFCPTRLLHEHE